MIFYLLILFLVVPLVELTILLRLASATSWQLTLLIVVVTGVVGTILARAEGGRTLRRMTEALDRGEVPTDSLVDAFLIFAAGAVLLTPGILTDLLGLAMLVPATRQVARSLLMKWLKSQFNIVATHSGMSMQSTHEAEERVDHGDDEIVDSYVVREEEADS